jgi:hypothetical protein
MRGGAELPDIAEVVRRILERAPRDQQPILLAQRERVSATRYREWASDIADPGRRSARGILARNPDLTSITGSPRVKRILKRAMCSSLALSSKKRARHFLSPFRVRSRSCSDGSPHTTRSNFGMHPPGNLPRKSRHF